MLRPLIVANFKLHHTRLSTKKYLDDFAHDFHEAAVEVAIAPVTPFLECASNALEGRPIKLCAQNVFYEQMGPFTGEYSAGNLRELNVDYCIVGHSERRKFFNETDEDVRKKINACLSAGVAPIICVGESLKDRENKKANEVVTQQVKSFASELQGFDDHSFVIAYEPIWAIGTGKVPKPNEIEEMHALIRHVLGEYVGEPLAKISRIIYGGSVNPENIREITSLGDVDGALVGGASLQSATFLSMVKELNEISSGT